MLLFNLYPAAETAEEYSVREAKWLAESQNREYTEKEKYGETGTVRNIAVKLTLVAVFLAFVLAVVNPAVSLAVLAAGWITLKLIHGKEVYTRGKAAANQQLLKLMMYVIVLLFCCVAIPLIISALNPEAAEVIRNIFSSPMAYIFSAIFGMILFMLLIQPLVQLVSIILRRIRCSERCTAVLKGYSAVDTDLPPDVDPSLGGYIQYTYTYDGTEYIISCKDRISDDVPGNTVHVKEIDLLIDPGCPKMYYDIKDCRKKIRSCLFKIIAAAFTILMIYFTVTVIRRELEGW